MLMTKVSSPVKPVSVSLPEVPVMVLMMFFLVNLRVSELLHAQKG
jgi:hypothetical protein